MDELSKNYYAYFFIFTKEKSMKEELDQICDELNVCIEEMLGVYTKIDVMENLLQTIESGNLTGEYVFQHSVSMEAMGINCLALNTEEEIKHNLMNSLEEAKNWLQRAWANVIELIHRFWNWITGKKSVGTPEGNKRITEVVKSNEDICDEFRLVLKDNEKRQAIKNKLKEVGEITLPKYQVIEHIITDAAPADGSAYFVCDYLQKALDAHLRNKMSFDQVDNELKEIKETWFSGTLFKFINLLKTDYVEDTEKITENNPETLVNIVELQAKSTKEVLPLATTLATHTEWLDSRINEVEPQSNWGKSFLEGVKVHIVNTKNIIMLIDRYVENANHNVSGLNNLMNSKQTQATA